MQAAVIILSVVAALLAAGVVGVARSRRATRKDLAATADKLTTTEEELAATRTTLTETEISAGKATTRAEAERTRAEAERTRAEAERTRADAAEGALADARAELEQARARAAGGEASVLGGLEAVRITRLWRDVAGTTEPPPLTTDDEVEAALNVLAEVSRESSGTTIAVDWKRTTPVPATLALLVVRVAEELIASVKHADRATLEVADGEPAGEGAATAVAVRILSEPPTPLPEGLAEVLGATDWVTSTDPGEVEVRIPA